MTKIRHIGSGAIARGKRIDELMREAGIINKELARRIGVNPTAAVNLRKGKTVPREETLERICKEFKTTPSWVLLGVGPKRHTAGAPQQMPGIPRRGSSAGHTGVLEWIRGTAEGQRTSKAERDWLRGCPWPEDVERAPDEAYALALQAFRITQESR